jgi:hypothetical protein
VLPLSIDPKSHGQHYANYLKTLPKSVAAENNRRARERAEKEAVAFTAAFQEGKCSICKSDLTSYVADQPCLHWLLKPRGFEKTDLRKVADRFSMAQIELYIRRVANQEAFAKNINDLADEGTGKLVELTANYKNLEWAISCGKGDYDGHGSNSEESKRPHYHFQMRIDKKPYIDYADFHIPLHDSDIVTMEAERLAPAYVTRRFAGGEGMSEVFKEEIIERLALEGKRAENEADGIVKFDHLVIADKGTQLAWFHFQRRNPRSGHEDYPLSPSLSHPALNKLILGK